MNESYGEIINKEIYVSIFNQLLEISINHKLFNKEIITPFLICFLYFRKVSKLKNELNPLLITFGKYNFNEILKTYEFSQTTLNVYFNILQTIDSDIRTCIINSLLHIEKLYKSGTITESFLNPEKIRYDQNSYEINKLFYKNFGETVTVEDKSNHSLHYEKDEVLKNENALNIKRYAGITKKYSMKFLINSYNYKTDGIWLNEFSRYSVYHLFEAVLDSMITGINSKIVSLENCKQFLEFLNELNKKVKIKANKDKHPVSNTSNEKETDENLKLEKLNFSLLDIIIKDLILNKKTVFEKLAKVLCFIYHPQNFYNIFFNKNETFSYEKLNELIKANYDLNKFKINEENFKFEEINLSNKIFLKDNLSGLMEMDKETSEFLETYYKDYQEVNRNMKIFQNDRYKFEFENFLNFMRSSDNLYYSTEQLEIFKDDLDLKSLESPKDISEKNPGKISLMYLLVNLSKISNTIEEFFLNNPMEEILGIYNDIKVDRKNQGKIKNIAITSKPDNSDEDLSDITREDILTSNLFYEYLKNFMTSYENSETKPVDFKKYKLDKSIDRLIKNFPIFPFEAEYGFSTKTNPSEIEWLIVSNTKYKDTQITDLNFENKLSYLKSQYSNIIII